jgi:hypothetical protein
MRAFWLTKALWTAPAFFHSPAVSGRHLSRSRFYLFFSAPTSCKFQGTVTKKTMYCTFYLVPEQDNCPGISQWMQVFYATASRSSRTPVMRRRILVRRHLAVSATVKWQIAVTRHSKIYRNVKPDSVQWLSYSLADRDFFSRRRMGVPLCHRVQIGQRVHPLSVEKVGGGFTRS